VQVRAFAGWPGTAATFHLEATASEPEKSVAVKITRTCVASDADMTASSPAEDARIQVCATKNRLLVSCSDGECLEILELQPTGKKAMPASAYINGLKGRHVFIKT